MLGNGLPFVGNLLCIWLYLQILFKYRPTIKNMPFCDFQLKHKYTKCLCTNTYMDPTLVSGVFLFDHCRTYACELLHTILGIMIVFSKPGIHFAKNTIED